MHVLKIRTCQRNNERNIMLDVTKEYKTLDLTKLNILKKIRQLKWRWTGHMTRRIKWKIVTEWQPSDGISKRGSQV